MIRKLGNTYKEANIKRHQLEAKVQREFQAELNKLIHIKAELRCISQLKLQEIYA